MNIKPVKNVSFQGGIIKNVPLVETGFFAEKIVPQDINIDDIVCINSDGQMVVKTPAEKRSKLAKFFGIEATGGLEIVKLPTNLENFNKIVEKLQRTLQQLRRTDDFKTIDFKDL